MVTDPAVETASDLARRHGATEEEIAAAAAEGTGALVALFADRAFLKGTERLTRREVASRAGITVEQAAEFWRALGFADVSDTDAIFTEADADIMRRVKQLMELGVIERELALQFTRVLGRAGAQIAAAQVDLVRHGLAAGSDEAMTAMLAAAPALLEELEGWMAHVWRRHLVAEAKRTALQVELVETGSAVVGFADLVGFSGISQQLDEATLAEAVARFESTAIEMVGSHGGRVVKMIGDEVMFEAPSAREGALMALDLVDAFASDDTLPDIRVGLASGPAVRNQGDLFGTAPNLASRLVEAAYPAALLVSDSVHDELEGDDDFSFKSVRRQHLKGFGRTRFWVLRRPGKEAERPERKVLVRFPEIPFLERDR
jgi:adenylate cyclase